jgi:hypothetical protein
LAISFKKTISDGVDPDASSYEIRYRARVIDNLHRRAKAFGFVLQPTAPVSKVVWSEMPSNWAVEQIRVFIAPTAKL